MPFRADIANITGLETSWMQGLRALDQADRERLEVKNARELCGSVAIDSALRELYPTHNRWDYVVCKKRGRSEAAHFIEVHPARTPSHVRDVAAKADWLIEWLRSTPLAAKPRELHWVATGTVSFPPNSPLLKVLATKGVVLRGKRLKL